MDSPRIVQPEDPDSLDPEVSALLGRLAERARANLRDPEAFVNLCLSYEANQLWREARDCYRQALRLKPDESAVGLHLAATMHNTGEVEEGYQLLLELSQEHPSSAAIQSRLAEASLDRGALDAATSAFQRLIELHPNGPEGHAGLGAVLLLRANPDDAIPFLKKAIQLDPSYGMPHYLLGTAYRKMGRLEEAQFELAKGSGFSVRQLPDELSARLGEYRVNASDRSLRAAELLRLGRPGEAAVLLEGVAASQPDNVTNLNNLSVAYLRQGRYEEAESILERARKADPGKFSTYLNLASLARRQSRFEDALRLADEAVTRAPGMAQPFYARAQALAELGRFDEALGSVEKVISIDSNQAPNHAFAGELSLRLDRHRQAREHFLTALEIEPRFLPARLGLINAAWTLGLVSEAREALKLARQQAPRHAQVAEWTQRLAGESP